MTESKTLSSPDLVSTEETVTSLPQSEEADFYEMEIET